MVELTEEQLLEISEENDFSFEKTKEYYESLIIIPCVQEKDDTFLYDCLTTLVQDRTSEGFKRNTKTDTEGNKSVKLSKSEALYRIYGDDALPYLTDEFLREKDIHPNVLRRTLV